MKILSRISITTSEKDTRKVNEMGLIFNKMKKFYISGTTSSVADEPLLEKPKNRWNSSHVFPWGFVQESVYLEEVDRKGSQFKTDEADFETNGTTTNITYLRISPTRVVAAYSYNSKGYAKVILIASDGTITYGTRKEIAGGIISSISLVKISNTGFAMAFIDEGSSDYLAVRVCTFNASGTITAGTKKTLVSAALGKNGTGVCMPKTGVLAFAHVLASDGHLDVICATFDGTTVDNPGAVVEFDSTASSTLAAICTYADGLIAVAYADGGTNGTYILGKVYSNALVEVDGSSATFETTGAATAIKIISPTDDVLMFSWIDANKAHALAATISSSTVSPGSELELTSVTTLTLDVDWLDDSNFVAAFEDDANTDRGTVLLFSRNGTLLTTGKVDRFTLTPCKITAVAALGNLRFLVGFADDGDGGKGKIMLGEIETHLIDVRSRAASIGYGGYLVSLENAGLGKLAAYRVTGTSDSSANQPMGTKTTLPFRKHQNIMMLFMDEGMYVEDDGTNLPKLSGVAHTDATRTIDIRSQVTSEAFVAYVIKINNKIRHDAI